VAAASKALIDEWVSELSEVRPRVLLADGEDSRAVSAATWLSEHSTVQPVLLRADSDARGGGQATASPEIDTFEVLDVSTLASDPTILEALGTRPDGSQRPREEVLSLSRDPLYLAAAHVAAGKSDACVAGASRPTRDVIRAGLKVIGLAQGASHVSSSFLIVLPDGRRLGYGDCAVLPTPDEQQLADVAVATARTYHELTGDKPAVAMLSFSTLGSADHPDVDRVRSATALARALEPNLTIDGELQFDAALLESVGRAKANGSPVAGQANVLIFPNLAAGNIAYKITERLGGAAAIGPVLQGLAAPLNDLSRGCSSEDVVSVALVSALQSLDGQQRS
jgi:phosphotransacetylase